MLLNVERTFGFWEEEKNPMSKMQCPNMTETVLECGGVSLCKQHVEKHHLILNYVHIHLKWVRLEMACISLKCNWTAYQTNFFLSKYLTAKLKPNVKADRLVFNWIHSSWIRPLWVLFSMKKASNCAGCFPFFKSTCSIQSRLNHGREYG